MAPKDSPRDNRQSRRDPAYERPFEVSPQAIGNLGSDEFVAFVANLISAEVTWYGGASTDILANLAPGPDQGRDILTHRLTPLKADDSLVPLGRAIWQCKALLATPGIDDFVDEMSKPEPMACLSAGGTFIFVAQNPKNNEDVVEAALKSLALSNSFHADQVRLYAQTKLAGFARRHPSLSLLSFFQSRPVGIEPFELWEKDHASSPFEPSAHKERLAQLCAVMKADRFHAAVTGATGVGKSRLVLEAIRERGFASYVAYARGPGPRVDELVEHIRFHARPCILVVDECDRAQAFALRARLASTSTGLITIEVERDGGASRPPDGDALIHLTPLPVKVISKVLEGNAGLGPDARNWIARQTGGFIKLAKLVGDELARDPSAVGSLASLSIATEVDNALSRMLGNSQQQVDLMKLFSCFSSIEHTTSAVASPESVMLAEKLGIHPFELHSLVSQVKREQILMDSGGFIYVTPDLMAQWLQESFLKAYGSLFAQWLPTFPQQLQAAHSRQLERLRSSNAGREWASRLVRTAGPFGDLLARRQPWADSILLALGAAAKDAVIDCVGAWARKEADAAHQVVERDGLRFILFRLMRTPRGFDELFGLLVDAFAIAGTENGPIRELLQGMLVATPGLSSTLAPYEKVVAAVREQLRNRGDEVRAALVDALGEGLLSPTGDGYSEYDRDPDDTGRGATSIETIREAVKLISEAMEDESPNVRNAAARFFVNGPRNFVNSPMADEFFQVVSRAVEISGDVGALASELDLILAHDEPSPELAGRVRALRTSLAASIESRMRLVLQGWSVELPVDDQTVRPTAADVAQELVDLEEHRLSALMSLVFSDAAQNSGELMFALGKHPGGARVWRPILSAACKASNAWPAAQFLATARDAGMALSPPAITLLYGDAFYVEVGTRAITMSASTDAEVETLADRLSSGTADPAWALNCTIARWNEHVTVNAVTALLHGLLSLPLGAPVAVSLAFRAVESKQGIATGLILTAIERAVARVAGHNLWTWNQLAVRMAADVPADVFDAVLTAVAERGPGCGDDEIEAVLARCCDKIPALAERLLTLWDQHPRFVSGQLGDIITKHISKDQLIVWASQDRERQRALGRMLIPSDIPLTVALIEHFGDTSPTASALESTASSGTWSGNISGFYESRGNEWTRYANCTSSPRFARFARRIGERLLRAAEQARVAEAAEDARDR